MSWLLRFALGACLCCAASAQDWNSVVSDYFRGRDFCGTVLIGQGSEVRAVRSFGLAQQDLGIPNRPDLLYRIGSLTKPVTAAAIMLLQQEGRVQLSDPLCKFLKPCPEEWSAVRLEHLLSHTSGVPNLFNAMKAVPVAETGQELQRAIAASQRNLISVPGIRYEYNNFGYVLLGAVIESVTGLLWEDVLRREIFEKTGMKDTRYDDVWSVIRGRATGYSRQTGTIRPIPYKDHAAYSAGGLLSSAEDLFRFVTALFNGRLWNEETVREITRPRLEHYGLGWQIMELNGELAYNHTGGVDGFSSHMQYYPRTKLTVIVLCNVEDVPVKKIATELAALVLR